MSNTNDRKPIRSQNTWPLVRFIVPAYPGVSIFTRAARGMTPLGLVAVATAASKGLGFRVEVLDENSYTGPRGKDGLPDHALLQKQDPAAVVGIYCGLSWIMDRAYDLSRFYHEQGVFNIAGGLHTHYCPDEALKNGFDIVVHGDGEMVIREILLAWKNGRSYESIAGISFWKEPGVIGRNDPEKIELPDLSDLPYPDFGLIIYPGKISTYPISRVRGCRMACEFCSVKGCPRWASPDYAFGMVNWLVMTRGARSFFIVDDRVEEDLEGLLEFFRLIEERYGNRLRFTVQVRLEAARNVPFLEAMKRAGVDSVCIGFESPIDEELRAMHKGIRSKDMVELTRVFRKYFWVHGMFIWGYPSSTGSRSALSVLEKIRRFKNFIKSAGLSTIQVLHPVPLVGTELRDRLVREGRVFPLEVVPWRMYDGSYVCFTPDEGMTIEEFQEAPMKLMRWFYSRTSFFRVLVRTLWFPAHYLVAGWHHWHYGWLRDVIKYGGSRLIGQWQKREENRRFADRLRSFLEQRKA